MRWSDPEGSLSTIVMVPPLSLFVDEFEFDFVSIIRYLYSVDKVITI